MNREIESREEEVLKKALHDIAENAVPDQIDVWQYKHESILMKGSKQMRNVPDNNRRKASFSLKPIYLTIFILCVVLGMLFLPQENALADQILNFFQIIPSTRPLATPFPTFTSRPSPTLPMHQITTPDSILQNEEVTPATTTPQSSTLVFRVDHPSQGPSSGSDQTLPLDSLAQVAGFEANTPAVLQGYSLRKSVYNEDFENVVLFYSANNEGRSHLMIVLTETAVLNPFEAGMDAEVEQVTVGEESGELVLGGWSKLVGETVERWNNEDPVCTVRWQAEDIYYTLQVMELREPIGPVGSSIPLKEEALSIAQSIMEMPNHSPSSNLPTPDPSCLSLAEAEKLAGFDAKIPARLPEGVALSCVKYQYIFWPEIELRYQAQDEQKLSLLFSEASRNALPEGKITLGYPPEKIEKVMILKWPGDFVAGSWTSRFPNDWLPGTQTPTPAWKPDSSSHLSWGDEDIWIIMNSYEGLEKEEMIRIAESVSSH